MLRFFDFIWQFKKFFNIGARERAIKRHTKVINEFAKEVITRRRNDEHKSLERQDLISYYIRTHKEKKQEISDEEMRDVITNFMVAGRDTTACALSWLFYELTQHPDVEAKILEEIRKARQVCEEEGFELASMLQYTECALLESLRLHPPVPGDDREALADDRLPDGSQLKKGDHVCFDPYVTNRCSKIWGEDVLQYKPQRWWDENEKKIKNVSAFEFPTFSAGQRLCLGKNLAILEVKALVSEILPQFRFILIPNQEITYKVTVTLVFKNGLKMNIEHRK